MYIYKYMSIRAPAGPRGERPLDVAAAVRGAPQGPLRKKGGAPGARDVKNPFFINFLLIFIGIL